MFRYGKWIVYGLLCTSLAQASTHSEPVFIEESPQIIEWIAEEPQAPLLMPWFKPSLLDLQQDLIDADSQQKDLLLYFTASYCAYCEQFIETTLSQTDVQAQVQRDFDLVALNVLGTEQVITPDGERLTSAEFAKRLDAQSTPSLIFVRRHPSTGRAEVILQLTGYLSTYQFRAALEYIVSHRRGQVQSSFRDYLSHTQQTDTNAADIAAVETVETTPIPFSAAPYQLDRSQSPAQRPLLVLFEQDDCHACERLHQQFFAEPSLRRQLPQLDILRLNIHSTAPLLTPAGESTTVSAWAKQLGLSYTPSLVFFNAQGQQILAINAIEQLNRLPDAFRYISAKAYEKQDFVSWYVETRLASLLPITKAPTAH